MGPRRVARDLTVHSGHAQWASPSQCHLPANTEHQPRPTTEAVSRGWTTTLVAVLHDYALGLRQRRVNLGKAPLIASPTLKHTGIVGVVVQQPSTQHVPPVVSDSYNPAQSVLVLGRVAAILAAAEEGQSKWMWHARAPHIRLVAGLAQRQTQSVFAVRIGYQRHPCEPRISRRATTISTYLDIFRGEVNQAWIPEILQPSPTCLLAVFQAKV